MKISAFIPPIFIQLIKKLIKNEVPIWSGNYKTWYDAKINCSGYDQNNILNKCASSLKLVKNGKALYERDSVIFNEKQYSWPLISSLLDVALQNSGNLCVLDFGGSLGSTYYQSKEFLANVKKLDWCIIEQQNFVDKGKQEFETDELHFFYNVEECLAKHSPNIIILSSVLQYLEDPYKWIHIFKSLNIDTILIDRTAFGEAEKDFITKQTVPDQIYSASYPMWFFNHDRFLDEFAPQYNKVAEFESYCDKPLIINNKQKVKWMGFILQKVNDV